MHACMYVCMYVYVVGKNLSMYVCMYVCTYVCMYVCICVYMWNPAYFVVFCLRFKLASFHIHAYVCMHVCMYTYMHFVLFSNCTNVCMPTVFKLGTFHIHTHAHTKGMHDHIHTLALLEMLVEILCTYKHTWSHTRACLGLDSSDTMYIQEYTIIHTSALLEMREIQCTCMRR